MSNLDLLWRAAVLALLVWALGSGVGCVFVTVQRANGDVVRASATGNGTILVTSNSVSAVAVDSAETYRAAGELVGAAAGAALKTAVHP